jgi:hypothetical protein
MVAVPESALPPGVGVEAASVWLARRSKDGERGGERHGERKQQEGIASVVI